MIKKILLVILFISCPLAAGAAEPVALKYEGYWGGIKVGDMEVRLDVQKDAYKSSVMLDSVGMIRYLTNYWSKTYADGLVAAGKYLPLNYDTLWALKKHNQQQHVVVTFARNGEEVSEAATPPENRNKRPAVDIKDKKQTLDPVTAAMAARDKVRELVNSGAPLPQNFSIQAFDSRRVFTLDFTITGYETRNIKDIDRKLLKVTMKRIPVAGFNPKELDLMHRQEPVFEIYLDDNFIPVWSIGRAPIGSAVIMLSKVCYVSGCKLEQDD